MTCITTTQACAALALLALSPAVLRSQSAVVALLSWGLAYVHRSLGIWIWLLATLLGGMIRRALSEVREEASALPEPRESTTLGAVVLESR